MAPDADVLIVGGGPAGAACGYWLAKAGHDVLIVERKAFPREKTCGDGLTPRAVYQLEEMGLAGGLEQYHRYEGLRALAHGITLEMNWPDHPVFPSHGYVVRRRDLDQMVADHAVAAGARLRTQCEAVAPLLKDGLVRGAEVKDHEPPARPRRSRPASWSWPTGPTAASAGRSAPPGTAATRRAWPSGATTRARCTTTRGSRARLDMVDRNGNSLPGYGWIFPVGDGTINVGVGLLSTFRDYRSINTSHLLDEFALTAPDYWEIGPETKVGEATGGRLPMAGSVSPKVGPTWIVIGDAAGSINPFNGEGIDYAYETGRMAADLLDESLVTGDARALQTYPQLLDDEYGLYFRVARAFTKIIGRPALMRELTRVGMHSQSLMEWVLRIMANLLREDELGPAEAAYRSVARIARMVPERPAA